jgi:uncharacterized membrane protein
VLESVLTFLFKYPPRVFQRGDLVIAPVVSVLLLALLALVAIALLSVMYGRLRAVGRRDRIILGVLRGAAILLVLACLLRPSVLVSSAVPQRNVFAVLLDDSRSMRLKDVGGAARLAAVQRVFADTSDLMRRLSGRFALRVFRFAADASPGSAATLSATGARTDLAAALDVTREDLAGMPLAGVVVVTDGADNGGGDLGASLLALRARRVPIYTVGVGQERFARDVAVQRVSAPSNVLAGSSVLLDAAVAVRGVGGEKTTMTVEANGRIVTTEEVTLPREGDVARVRLRVPPLAPGSYRISVRARALSNETVTENNDYHFVLDVKDGPVRVLYFEGEPRPEFAFLRRAVSTDSSIQVVGLMRSAERKFLRLGVRDSLELMNGFPIKREELFQYRAIILGSVESSFFTGDQLRMLGEFVSQRGGTLLALGGRSSLAEGGFAGTPMAEALPVTIDRGGNDSLAAPVTLAIHPTSAGVNHGALQLRATERASALRWDSLPPLTSVNRLGTLRSGATVLLTGRAPEREGERERGIEQPVLAFQRYGRGMGAVFGVQDSWLWRMHATIPVEDATHATFWKQLVRWMVSTTPDQVEIAALPSRVGPGEPVTLRAQVSDSTFLPVNDATVTGRVTTPSGRIVDVPMDWSMREDGSYTGRLIAEEKGLYTFAAEVRRGRDTTRSAASTLLADDAGADVEQAELRSPLLRRIANESGGQYYSLEESKRLVDDALFTESGVTTREARDLWDMPIVFFLLAALLGAEWIYRRRRGLS